MHDNTPSLCWVCKFAFNEVYIGNKWHIYLCLQVYFVILIVPLYYWWPSWNAGFLRNGPAWLVEDNFLEMCRLSVNYGSVCLRYWTIISIIIAGYMDTYKTNSPHYMLGTNHWLWEIIIKISDHAIQPVERIILDALVYQILILTEFDLWHGPNKWLVHNLLGILGDWGCGICELHGLGKRALTLIFVKFDHAKEIVTYIKFSKAPECCPIFL